MTTRIKICGIDDSASAQCALALGVDAIGLVFIPGSARVLTTGRAAQIAALAHGQVTRVGLFADQDPQTVAAVCRQVDLDVLQFHGRESGPYCRSFGRPYIKAFVAAEDVQARARAEFSDACAWLLDATSGTGFGGTGRRFDLALWPPDAAVDERWALAGGLDADNVGTAIASVRPWAVDVSSGVEGAQRGRKDPQRMHAFVAAVRQADALILTQGPHGDR